MAILDSIEDKHQNRMDYYVNDKNKGYIRISNPEYPDDENWIVLELEDLTHLIKKFSEMKKQIEENQ